MTQLKQKYITVDVDDVVLHPDNPRIGNVEAIARSIQKNGFFGALIIQKSTRHVLVGNHRLRAARDVGIKKVSAIEIDCDDDVARRILLADNRLSDVATYDDDVLLRLLEEIDDDDLLSIGYSVEDIEALMNEGEETMHVGDAEREDIDEMFGVVVTCVSEREQTKLLNELTAKGFECRALLS